MDDHKICFISCVSNSLQYEQSLQYLLALQVPDGYTVEWIPIEHARSMTSGYHSAMKRSDAKYKVYLHQDVWIIYPQFIDEMLRLFRKYPQLGMIGVAGAKTIPPSGIWWESPGRYGKVFSSHTGSMSLLEFQPVDGDYENVRAIDGLIMITQADLPWREELFTGWHFYDTSQSLEMIKAGYEVGVFNQGTSWCIHNCGISKLEGYEQYRHIFLHHYQDWLA
jgi:hypothetical protein